MKRLTLFDRRVDVVLTEISDGSMKVVREMSPDSMASARQNRLRAVASLGLDSKSTALLRVSYAQDDFCKFISLESVGSYSLDNDLSASISDGILTSTRNLGIFLPLADCLGMVLFDPRDRVLMVVHCGRHTLLQDGASKAVEFAAESLEDLEPENLRAWFSPCAGRENYPLYQAGNKGLQELATEQLVNSGVSRHAIELSTIDTTTSPDFFSHSRGDTTARFAICAKMNP